MATSSLIVQIRAALLNACKSENFSVEPHELEKIVERSEGNFRKALLITEMRANQYLQLHEQLVLIF